MSNIERWSAVAATLVDLAKRDLPPHISEAEQVEAYLGLKRIAADYRGAVDAIRDVRRAALVGLTANDQTARLYKGALARVVEITDDALKGQ